MVPAVKVHRVLPLLILWLVFLIPPSVLLVSDRIRASFLTESTYFAAMIQYQLFFILVLFPLWVPRALKPCADAREGIALSIVQVAGLFCVALPVNLVGQGLSNVDAGGFAAACAIVAASSMLVASLYVLAWILGWNLHAYYYFGLFVTQAVFPYVGYLTLEFSGSPSWPVLRMFSPFWAAAAPRADSTAFVQAALFAGVAAVLAIASWRRRPGPPALVKS